MSSATPHEGSDPPVAVSRVSAARASRAAMTDGQACTELLENAGSQFDERVVAALLQVLAERPALSSP